MADAHLTYCESLGEWSTRCTCDEGFPCADIAREIAEDRAEHEARDEGNR